MDWLKVIAEPNRLRILDLLMQGEQCNCEMGSKLNMTPNLISHHMSVLQQSGLVDARRDPDDARWIHYSIESRALAQLSSLFSLFFNPTRMLSGMSTCELPVSTSIDTSDTSEMQ